ncbi:MAG: hypothetical protein ABI831_23180 [Betaproteobacteria bacterium]
MKRRTLPLAQVYRLLEPGPVVVEVVTAWIKPGTLQPRTIHHCGHGMFMVAGRTIKVPSRMK